MKFALCLLFSLTFHAFFAAKESHSSALQHGIKLYETGKLHEARDYFLKLEQELEPDRVKDRLDLQNNLGNVYADLGENTKALKAYQQALWLSKTKHFKAEEAKIYKNIGALYLSWKKFDQAESYYLKALQTAKEKKDEKLLADCYNNLGTVYEQVSDLRRARKAYEDAMRGYAKLGLELDLAMTYSNLAIVCKLEQHLPEAIAYNLKALEISKKYRDDWMVAAIQNNIGNAYRELKQFDAATDFCQQSLKLSDSIQAVEIQLMALETLSEINRDQGKFQLAHDYLKEMVARNAEFINRSQTQQFSELEVRFQTKEKELKNQQLRLQNENIQKRQQLMLISFLVLLLLLAVIFYGIYRFKRQKDLQQKQLEINKAIILSENKERFRIAGDLHDSVGQMLSVIKMKLPEADHKLGELMDQTIQEVRNISHDLIPEALNFGLLRALEELVQKCNSEQHLQVEFKHALSKQDLNLGKDRELSLFRIVQELVSNSIKHSGSKHFDLHLELKSDLFYLHFNDHGTSFHPDQLKKSTGLGWLNIYARLNAIQGSIEFKDDTAMNLSITLKNEG